MDRQRRELVRGGLTLEQEGLAQRRHLAGGARARKGDAHSRPGRFFHRQIPLFEVTLSRMLRFLKRIFNARREPIVDPDLSPEEFWQTDFSKPSRSRFLDETGDSYQARISQRGLTLAFEKKNVYAWTINPIYQYKDFILEALLEFPGKKSDRVKPLPPDGITATLSRAGSMSAGFLIRYQSETTFYSVLLSDEGLIRMDAVVNGTPIPVLGWTEIRKAETDEAFKDEEPPPYINNASICSLRIISQGDEFYHHRQRCLDRRMRR